MVRVEVVCSEEGSWLSENQGWYGKEEGCRKQGFR